MHVVEFNQSALKSLFSEEFSRASREFLREQPQPDPQYTIEEVADILSVDPSTVRNYLKLSTDHRRYLPFVQCTDTGRGNRIRLSDVQAWQQRNLHQPEEAEAQLPESLLRISHRRAARREKRNAA
ncbi:helix-turn-helix domain-containing protein [Hymenobacter rigui]|uniref:DNA-binding protein n=1 Tax=Hymenobacter rigui TaxID=334424 RepID=A0A428KTY3_9BACT|nr:helix-turn-helix domain-containing protein [Hymenobacter rigui]RSK50071.1 DNA-binding protein [Hymenobacter rigui]